MALHTLEMMMKVQTGEVVSSLNSIENKITALLSQVNQFTSSITNGLSSASTQAGVLSDILLDLEASQAAEDLLKSNEELHNIYSQLGLINSRGLSNKNIVEFKANIDRANEALLSADGLASANNVKLIEAAKLSQKVSDAQAQIAQYEELVVAHSKDMLPLMKKLETGQSKWSDLTTNQQRDVEKILTDIRELKKISPDIEDTTGIILENYDGIREKSKETVTWSQKWDEITGKINKNLTEIDQIIPGLGQIGMVLSPWKTLGKEISSLNKMYEHNHTVSVNFMQTDLMKTTNLTQALSRATIDATDDGILLAETRKALTDVLQSGQVAAINDADAMVALTKATAETTRATGLNGKQLAKLTALQAGINGEIQDGIKLQNKLISVQAKTRLTTAQMSKITDVLSKNFHGLNAAFTTYDKKGNVVVSGSEAVVVAMSEVARAAAKAGADADAAMDLFAKALQDPIAMAPLLGDALMSNNPDQMMAALGENAVMLAEQLESMPIALQNEYAKAFGTTSHAIFAAAESQKQLTKDIEEYAKQNNLVVGSEEARTKFMERQTKEQEAATAAEIARGDAIRQLQHAIDPLIIAFAELATTLQPVVTFIAEIIKNPVSKWFLLGTAAVVGFVGAIKVLAGSLTSVFGVFTKFGSAAKSIAGSAKQGGLIASFGEGLKKFLNSMAEIKWSGILKGATMIVVFSAALAAGVYMLSQAANAMTPEEMMALALTSTIIVATSFIISKIPANAIVGALTLALVGGALALGLWLIGMAMEGWTIQKALTLMLLSGIMLATMGILALLGIPAVAGLAILGAVALAIVGASLSLALFLLGKATDMWSIDKALVLLGTVGTVLGVMAMVALMGVLAVPAMIGALALIGVAAALWTAFKILGAAGSSMDKFAKSFSLLVKSMKGLTPAMGAAMISFGAGMAAFGAALAGGAIMEFLGGDMVETAGKMGEAMSTLVEPITALTAVENAGANLKSIGEGLSTMANALDQGGVFGLFTPDFVGNAKALGEAMEILESPISKLAALGIGAGIAFKAIGAGVKQISSALEDDSIFKLFSSDKVANATELARAMSVLAEPVRVMAKMGVELASSFKSIAAGVNSIGDALERDFSIEKAEKLQRALGMLAVPLNSLITNISKAFAEEMQTGLNVNIEGSLAESNEEVVEAINNLTQVIEDKSDAEAVAELKKLGEVFEEILGEMSMGNSFGSTSANQQYNA